MAKSQDIVNDSHFGEPVSAPQLALMRCSADYFKVFHEAVSAARKRVYILAWDINSKIELIRHRDKSQEADEDILPTRLGELIDAALERTPELHVYICLWDYSMIYMAEREFLPSIRFTQKHRERVHIVLDDTLPLGASHHEKMVIVDEELAFCGGLDLGKWRWDTTEHLADDPRRETPEGERYPPFHDTQLMFNGEAAQRAAEIFRYRWERADGGKLQALEKSQADSRWIEGVGVDFREVVLTFFRTQAAYKDYPKDHSIERMHLESIAQAEKLIYFENQYFSSRRIMEALAKSLEASEGPEIIMILTEDTDGWLEEGTMGVMRDYLIGRLREADKHGRFRVFYPHRTDKKGHSTHIYTHSKLHTVDDRMLKLGSSNLSNRSMRVDTECDVLLQTQEHTAQVARIRTELIAILAGLDPEEVAQCLRSHEHVVDAMDAIAERSEGRLIPFPEKMNSQLKDYVAENIALDPEEPLDPDYWVEKVFPESHFKTGTVTFITIIVLLAALALVAFLML